jgi:glycosyltransferase involved in cell wall biosynthesis
MRIAFDGTSLRPRRTGVGYYTEHLLHHLAAEANGSEEIVVLSNREVETATPLPPHVRVTTSHRRLPRMVWMQTGAPAALRHMRADVAHFTNGILPIASPTPAVVTIHDMSLRLYPRYHPIRRVLLNAPLVDLAARHADAIVTVSETAKRDIVRLYKLDSDRVHVVHEAAAPSFRPVTDPEELDRVRCRYQLADRIVLYVGTIEPRKNLPKLIEAFASRKRSGDLPHHLVCVGPYGWLSRGLEDLIQRSRVSHAIQFTGYVPFEDLPALYSLAELFVYPSMYEGFGLPVIEAMACGTPVITGRAAALAEVGGDAVEQVERMDVDALGDAMARLAKDPQRRAELSANARARAERFSWQRAARETMNVYRAVAKPAVVRSWFDGLTTSGVLTHAAPLEPDQRRVGAAARPEHVEGRAVASGVDVLFGQAYFLRFDPKLSMRRSVRSTPRRVRASGGTRWRSSMRCLPRRSLSGRPRSIAIVRGSQSSTRTISIT